MPIRQFQVHVHNLSNNERPVSPQFRGRSYSSFDDSSTTPSSPSTASDRSWEHTSAYDMSKGRRRRRATAITLVSKPTNSPKHDRPMTRNDIYFALDCEVRINEGCLDGQVLPVIVLLISTICFIDGWHWSWRPRLSCCSCNHL
jgi:hypothetical protein